MYFVPPSYFTLLTLSQENISLNIYVRGTQLNIELF